MSNPKGGSAFGVVPSRGSNNDPVFWEVFNERTNPEDIYVEEDGWGTHRVYFLHFPLLRRVKIGYTSDLPRRRKRLTWQAKSPCVLLGVLNGGRELETLILKKFASHRLQGEWFSEDLIEEAESLIRADREHYGTAPAA